MEAKKTLEALLRKTGLSECSEVNESMVRTLTTIDGINLADSLTEAVSSALSDLAEQYKSICSVSLEYDSKTKSFQFEMHNDRVPEEFKEQANHLSIDSYLFGLISVGTPVDDSARSYIVVPIQSKKEGVKKTYGALRLVRDSKNPFSDIDKELVLRVARALGTAISDHYNQLKADTDYLTGAASRRKFEKDLEEEIRTANAYGKNPSLVGIDLDRFKNVNDTYGHPQGDSVLKELVTLCRRYIRKDDKGVDLDAIGRIGGEEFLMLLLETPIQRALEIAESLKKEVETHKFTNLSGKEPIKLTASFGVLEYSGQYDKPRFLDEVDKLLYQAKKTRNTVCGPNIITTD